MSHRGKHFVAVHDEAVDLVRTVFGVPDEFDVLFLQGGATLQFAMVPMNLLMSGQKAGYIWQPFLSGSPALFLHFS